MTQHEKDLQRAKEWMHSVSENATLEECEEMAEIALGYVQHIEAAGVIKYIARREEDNPIISTQKECRNCGYEVDNIDVICKTCHVFL